MKLLFLILTIFILNSCGQTAPEICPEKVCLYPTLPTYKIPQSQKFKVQTHSENASIISNDTLLELVNNNTKLRKTCSNYAVVNKRVNKEYSK